MQEATAAAPAVLSSVAVGMSVLAVLAWSAIAATAAWGLTLRRAARTIAVMRRDSEREMQHWKDLATRERSRSIQLHRELVSYSDGCRQGREDVASIVPLLQAALSHHQSLPHTGTEDASP
jgi:siroheme synthase